MNLSPHFTDEELGVVGVDPRIIQNAAFLCMTLLEPIRSYYNVPLVIHDGYRDPSHNARVGGKPTSWHQAEGGEMAADFNVHGVGCLLVFDYIRLQSKLPFDKLILEMNASGIYSTVHIQVDRLNPPRRQAFTGSTGAGVTYVSVPVL